MPAANGLPGGLVTAKHGKKSAVRAPASYDEMDPTFDIDGQNESGDHELSAADALQRVSALAGSSGVKEYSSLSAHGALSLSASEQWSAAFSRQDIFAIKGDAALPVILDADKPEDEEDDDFYDDKVTQDHLRLLYLVSLYSKPAENDEEKEVWIRSHALLVLIYEGIVTGVLDYDYSSQANVVGNVRVWMNISQEGKDDLDDLRDLKLINTIKLSTTDHGLVVAYQISFKGQKVLKRKLTQSSQDAVNSFCFTADGDPLHVGLEDRTFFFYTSDRAYKVQSKVSETEDVSYVSSPYLPECLRRGPRGMTSNAHRAFESAAGKSDIKDEYNEVVSLGDVRILIAEWVPFGDNSVASLMDKLGCQDRVQGGFFSDVIDAYPAEERLETPSGMTGVRVLEFDLLNFVNFEADIHFAEDEGIVQVENFGTHIRSDGFILYGLKIEAIMDHGADNVSLDLMSRLLMDIQNDSSRIIDSLVSEYQRSMLDVVFYGDRATRDKYNIILAEMITPKMSAELYLDGKEHESEIKQVLGDTFSAHNLSDDDVMIIGRAGLLLSGRGCSRFEPLLISYLTMICREKFVRYFYARVFLMDETLRKIRHLIDHVEEDPNTVATARLLMGQVSRAVILLDECLLYVEESLAHCAFASPGEDPALIRLAAILNAGVLFESMKRRVADMRKNVKGASVELMSIQKMTSVIAETQQTKIHAVLQQSQHQVADLQRTVELSMAHVELLKILLSGVFAMELLDRILGLHYNITDEGGRSLLPAFMEPLRAVIVIPGVLFALFLLFWFVLNKVWYERAHARMTKNTSVHLNLTLKYNFNVPVDIRQLKDMLQYKYVEMESLEREDGNLVKKVIYAETDMLKWRGQPPRIELQYDQQTSFLLRASFFLNRSETRLTSQAVHDIFVEDLALAKVITATQSKELMRSNASVDHDDES